MQQKEPVTLAQLAAIFADEVSPLLDEAVEPEAEQIELEGLAPEADSPVAIPEPSASGSENGKPLRKSRPSQWKPARRRKEGSSPARPPGPAIPAAGAQRTDR